MPQGPCMRVPQHACMLADWARHHGELRSAHVDYDARNLAPFGVREECCEAPLQFVGSFRWRTGWRRWHFAVAEPENQVDAVSGGRRVAGVLCDQLVLRSAPEFSMLGPLDLHGNLEVLEGNPDVRPRVVGIRNLTPCIDRLGQAVIADRTTAYSGTRLRTPASYFGFPLCWFRYCFPSSVLPVRMRRANSCSRSVTSAARSAAFDGVPPFRVRHTC